MAAEMDDSSAFESPGLQKRLLERVSVLHSWDFGEFRQDYFNTVHRQLYVDYDAS